MFYFLNLLYFLTQNCIHSWQKHTTTFLFEWQMSYIFLSKKAIHLNLIFIRITKKKNYVFSNVVNHFFYFSRHLHSFKALSDNSFLLFQQQNKPWLLLNFITVRFYFGFHIFLFCFGFLNLSLIVFYFFICYHLQSKDIHLVWPSEHFTNAHVFGSIMNRLNSIIIIQITNNIFTVYLP